MRRSKYGAIRTTIDGVTFASKREARRYLELKALQNCGLISRLQLQVRHPIVVNGKLVCTYISDFDYWDEVEHRAVIEDAKGYRERVYRLKCKLMSAVYGVAIKEV